MNFEELNQAEIAAAIKSQGDNKQQNPFLQKIDMSFIDREQGVDGIDYYRVLDGIDEKITAKLYDDLIPANFSEEEREEKADFQGFYAKDSESDARRENLNIVAMQGDKFVGLLTGMAFHKSKLGYFDYLVVDESVRSKKIGSKIFQAGKKLLKSVAQEHGYDHENLAVFLTVEKEDSTMNLDKGQDPRKRLAFYDRQNCVRVKGMPCLVPGIVDSETGEQKPPLDCFDWLVSGVNRDFKDGEMVMDRATALQYNADNIDLQYDDIHGRAAEETETYAMVQKSLANEIRAESLFEKPEKLRQPLSEEKQQPRYQYIGDNMMLKI